MIRHVSVLIVILFGCGGCETSRMWRDAKSPTCNAFELTSVVDTPTGRALVVRYVDYTPYSSWLLVPLDRSNRPSPPFAFDGPLAECGQMLRGVPTTQASAVDASLLQPVDADEPPGRKATIQPDPGTAWMDYFREHSHVFDDQSGATSVVLAGYRLDGDRLTAVSPIQDHKTQRAWYPPGTSVVVLPYQRDRPAAGVARSKTRAALLTPATLGFDGVEIILLPVVLIVLPLYLFGFAAR